MEDLISRQAVDDAIYDYSRSCDVNYAQIMEYIDKIPSVENKGEPKIGHWFIDERPESDGEIICSNCEQPVFRYHKIDFDYRPNFCPNCGAKMKGGE